MVAFKLMDMPHSCVACRFLTCRIFNFDYCDLMEQYVDVSLDLEKERDPNCPLVELEKNEDGLDVWYTDPADYEKGYLN